MRDFIFIGASPAEEDCVQLGTDNYYERARAECKRYIEAIRKKLGPEPEGAKLKIKRQPHDFGEYLEVVCYYEDTNEEATKYAFRCESDSPETWN